jgi:hypothetical protein
LKVNADERGRWSPEFRAWLRAYFAGTATPEELERLDRAAQEAGERLRRAAQEADYPIEVEIEAEHELDILAALRPSARGVLSPSLVAELLAADLDAERVP